MRILGVDFGLSRTGIALSDSLGLTCRPFAVVAEPEEGGLIARIVAIAREQEVGEIVVGLPRPLSGRSNRHVETVLAFSERLRREVPVPVVMWDERFTSKLAREGRPRAAADDAVAACYILQSYLDSGGRNDGGET